jgi:PKD repeat protein
MNKYLYIIIFILSFIGFANAATPIANFASTSTGELPPVTVQFTDASTNYPVSWNWSFGDGNVSVLQNPTHIYDVCGNITVLFRVENTDGVDWENKTNYLSIPCLIPTPAPTKTVKSPGFGAVFVLIGLGAVAYHTYPFRSPLNIPHNL